VVGEITAPEIIRIELRGLNAYRLLKRTSTYPPGAMRNIVSLTKFSLRMLARRAIEPEQEITVIDASLKSLVKEIAPEPVSTLVIGTDAASALLGAALPSYGLRWVTSFKLFATRVNSTTRSATRWIANSSAQNPLSRHSDQEGSSCLTICNLIRGSTRSTGEDRASTRSTPGTLSTEGRGDYLVVGHYPCCAFRRVAGLVITATDDPGLRAHRWEA
jgi:hypothetical protein